MPASSFSSFLKPRRTRSPRFGPGRLLTPRRLMVLALILAAAFFGYAFCQGRVVRVQDGDSITVLLKEGGLARIRLYGVDAPESAQKGGAEAARFTRELAAFQEVELREMDRDRYGRSVALVRLPDGRLLNEELIRAGHAWVYRTYCDAPVCGKWLAMEREARAEGRGLWRDQRPQPPWRWRQQHQRR